MDEFQEWLKSLGNCKLINGKNVKLPHTDRNELTELLNLGNHNLHISIHNFQTLITFLSHKNEIQYCFSYRIVA